MNDDSNIGLILMVACYAILFFFIFRWVFRKCDEQRIVLAIVATLISTAIAVIVTLWWGLSHMGGWH